MLITTQNIIIYSLGRTSIYNFFLVRGEVRSMLTKGEGEMKWKRGRVHCECLNLCTQNSCPVAPIRKSSITYDQKSSAKLESDR